MMLEAPSSKKKTTVIAGMMIFLHAFDGWCDHFNLFGLFVPAPLRRDFFYQPRAVFHWGMRSFLVSVTRSASPCDAQPFPLLALALLKGNSAGYLPWIGF
jgi:hypothetical protein